jgi:glycosyltransferase involved in cell wall biosynthesis
MRIGIDLTSIWRPATGNEHLAMEMTHALLRTDPRNEYVLFFSRQVHPTFRSLAGRFESILAPLTQELLVKHIWLSRAVAAAKLDYMHFPTFPPPWRLSCPMGWTLPDATPWVYPDTMKLKSRLYYTFMGARAVRTNRLLITDSYASRDDIINHVKTSPGQVHVIYPGLRSIFQCIHNGDDSERVRHNYHLPTEFILFVGTLEPRKNLSRILAACCALTTQHDFRPTLVIVGRKGWLYDPIFAELRNLGLSEQVRLTGYVPDEDLLALYSMARLLIFPSLYEGFGFPAIEAMACGCPVVTSNRGAQYEVTKDCAVHCDPENVTSIAEAMWQAYSDETLRARLVVNGVRRAASFSWNGYAERFLDVLGTVIEEGSVDDTVDLSPTYPAA